MPFVMRILTKPLPVSLVLLLSVAFSACAKDKPKNDEPRAQEVAAASAAAVASAAPAPEPAGPIPPLGGAAEYHEPQFDITVRANPAYAVGKEGSFDIVVEPKGGYHTNDRYPYKLKLQTTDGVKFPADVVNKDAVALEPMRATMKVSVTPTSAGEKQVGGQLSFSVCSAERCLIEKRHVVTTLRVN